jgi:tRNA nucleotidyltransferase/poly(A) polymerase
MDLSSIDRSILQDALLSRLSALATEKDISIYLVGGYIRDLLLGRRSQDYDLSLPAEASLFIPLIESALNLRFFKIGKEDQGMATYRFVGKALSVDLTLFQGSSIDDDLRRRDFTINAIAFSLRDRKVHAAEGALDDIQKRVIRTVTRRSIEDDPLRMLRAIRYLSTLERFEIDSHLIEEISEKKNLIERIPGERIKAEIDKILLSMGRSRGMSVFVESGLLLSLLPELRGLQFLQQGEYHHLDAFAHTFLALEKVSWACGWLDAHMPQRPLSDEDQLSLSYAALFHDLGKQDTCSRDEKGRVHFYDHETHSCRAAEGVMERLRFSNPMRKKVLLLIRNHMRIRNLPQEPHEPALKRLVNRLGDLTPLLVLLTLADQEASRGTLSILRDKTVQARCLKILDLSRNKEIVHPPLLIDGHDVMALGYSPGPNVGKILGAIREKQVVGEIKTREEALEILKQEFASKHTRQ